MLSVVKVTKHFGGLSAVNRVTFELNKKEILGIIGPNGAGKTTLLNLISGFYKPTSGKIILEGEDITRLSVHSIVRKGITRTFQIVRPFSGMTVLDNVMVGALFGGDPNAKRVSKAVSESVQILQLVGLRDKMHVLAKNLTIQDRKRLELARALATKPKVLLLDEVLAGLNPIEIEHSIELLAKLREDRDVSIIMVEHVIKALTKLSDRIIVLNSGNKIAEGTPEQVINHPEVIEAYLGEKLPV